MTTTIVSVLLGAGSGLLGIPVVVLLGEVLAALTLQRGTPLRTLVNGSRPRVAVLVPAHNEGVKIIPTLADIEAQLGAGDRLLVVADNCTDDTASVAASVGAEVVVRNDRDRVGKGYALDYGIRHLQADPPSVVMIIDADCRLGERALDHLARMSGESNRPAQALYLMLAPEPSAINHQVAAFAWRVKNWVRPLGLSALGFPCQLMGTGMAIPWNCISSVNVASGQIVEDLKLGLDLAAAGHPPRFCPSAVVSSEFPVSGKGADTQRERWEQGHIGLILLVVPRLLLSGILRRDLDLVAMALDLAVPPLALLMLLLLAGLAITAIAAVAGFSALAFQITAASCCAFAVAVVLAWWSYGHSVLPARVLLRIGPYVLTKLGLYVRLLTGRRAKQWIRTDRS